MKELSFFPLLLLLISFVPSYSQYSQAFDFDSNDSLAMEYFFETLDNQNKIELAKWKGKEYKEYRGFHKDRAKYMRYLSESNQFVFDKNIYPKINEILTEIKSANPQYTFSTANKILVGNSSVPNAVCYGNEILAINMGLLSRLDNESQLAAVIAHELAHQIFNHVDNGYLRNQAFLDSDEYKDKMKEISKADYGHNSMYNEFRINYLFKKRALSRKYESEADSMAYLLLRKTKYDNKQIVSLLKILDHSDEEKYRMVLNLDSVFKASNVEFKPEWIKTKEGLDVEQKFDQELIDSLKTHPDCDERIDKICKNFGLNLSDTIGVKEPIGFLRHIDLQLIKSDLKFKRYARALKNALLYQQLHPKEDRIKHIIGICLGELYLATKEHTVFDHVPKPDDSYESNYYKLLLMVDNIRLSELGVLFKEYYINNNLSRYKERMGEHGFYLEYLYAAISQNGKEEQLKNNYQSRFPKGIYFN